MAASYLRRGMTGTATFSLFVRSLPPARGFLVAAGVETCPDLVTDLRFDDDGIRYLRGVPGFEAPHPEGFRRLRFTGDVSAVSEGPIDPPRQPNLQVPGPLPVAQRV